MPEIYKNTQPENERQQMANGKKRNEFNKKFMLHFKIITAIQILIIMILMNLSEKPITTC